MELQYTKQRSQKPTSGPSPKPAQTSSKLHVVPSLKPILISLSYSRIYLLKFSNQNFVFISCFPIRVTGLQHSPGPKLLRKKFKLSPDFRSQYYSSQRFVLKRMLSNHCNIPTRNKKKIDKNYFMKLYTELVSLFQVIGNIPSLICYELLFNSFEGVWSWLLTQSSIPSSSLLTSHKDRLPLVFIALSLPMTLPCLQKNSGGHGPVNVWVHTAVRTGFVVPLSTPGDSITA